MKNKLFPKIGLAIVFTIVLIISLWIPLTIGDNVRTTEEMIMLKNYDYNCYHISETTNLKQYKIYEKRSSYDNSGLKEVSKVKSPQPMDGPMISPWPMYCHDTRHTSRSPYSTINNMGFEIWRLRTNGWIEGGPVIDNNGTIYIGAKNLYSVYPNGTLKWEYDTPYYIMSTPAIDENGILYVGTIWALPNYLYAIYTNNGTLKWKFQTANHIFSSPAIGDDGSIYFGSEDDYIYALYPNGTLKWKYLTNVAVYSSPAIGDDGTVYCGSHDCNLYALYPNNGTLKWKFSTGNWIRTSPCIDVDGTIYCVSLDGYLYAIYPNGTLKWKTDVGAGTSPTIGQNGTIYAGYRTLNAVNPTNGSVIWTFDVGGTMRGGTPCNSIDGTIYVGTSDGGELIAIYPDGTEKWRKSIGTCESPPAIGEDGTIYIGSSWEPSDGYLFAFSFPDPNAPETPIINGLTNGQVGQSYEYTFTTTDPNDDDVFYYIEWGDGTLENWLGPYSSGMDVKVSHIWSKTGTYIIRAQAKDINDLKSDWRTLEVTMPRNKIVTSSLFLHFLERFPRFERLLFL